MSYTNSQVDSILSKKIETKLLRWFEKEGRELPWRKTRDPYAIWVSEIMLQQTQVATVIPYYQNFLKVFPTIQSLARADLSKVLKVWEGLGYYSRARNLHQASKIVVRHFKGKIPDDLRKLMSLPGIGRYTAGAILSIAYNKEAPILDGNVRRVLARLFAISEDSKQTANLLWKISESLVPKGRSSAFNQAIMDLGAMVCIPKDPQCNRCPLCHLCKAKAYGRPDRYPLKERKKNIPHVVGLAAVIHKDGKVLLNQRPLKGLLGGLWEFPNWRIEDRKSLRLRGRLRNHIKKDLGMSVEVKESIGTFKQVFTHFKLTLHVFHCEAMDGRGKGKWVPMKELDQLAMSRMHRRITETIHGSEEGPRRTQRPIYLS